MTVFQGIAPDEGPGTKAPEGTIASLNARLAKARSFIPNLPHFRLLPALKGNYSKAQNFGYIGGMRLEHTINGVREAKNTDRPKSVRNALAVEEEKLRKLEREELNMMKPKAPEKSRPKLTNHIRYQQLVNYEGTCSKSFSAVFTQRLMLSLRLDG